MQKPMMMQGLAPTRWTSTGDQKEENVKVMEKNTHGPYYDKRITLYRGLGLPEKAI